MKHPVLAIVVALVCMGAVPAGTIPLGPATLSPNDSVATVTYQGMPAVKQVAPDDERAAFSVVAGTALRTGTIALDVAGDVRPGAPDAVRGFVGVAFNVAGNADEIVYLRTLNGRSNDQT